MTKNTTAWLDWGKRFRAHCREKSLRPAELSERLGAGFSEPTIRSWTNGTRQINLSDFFRLCKGAEADPSLILFGHPAMTDEVRQNLGQLAASILEADPSAKDSYAKLGKRLRTVKKV